MSRLLVRHQPVPASHADLASTDPRPSREQLRAKVRLHKVMPSARFRCRRVIGKGAFASVYEGVDQAKGKTVAIKVVNKTEDIASAQYEYFISQNLAHPNLVRTLECIKTRSHPLALVQEFVPGGELFAQIEPGFGVEEADARRYLRGLLAGLDHMHERGIVHRDVKPENVLLDAAGEPKLADFGMAEFTGERVQTQAGTVPYLPPEVAGAKSTCIVSPAHDVWSLGVVLYILLVGDFPWLEAKMSDVEFARFVTQRCHNYYPFNTFADPLNELFQRIFTVNPDERITLDEVWAYVDAQWFLEDEVIADAAADSDSIHIPCATPDGDAAGPCHNEDGAASRRDSGPASGMSSRSSSASTSSGLPVWLEESPALQRHNKAKAISLADTVCALMPAVRI